MSAKKLGLLVLILGFGAAIETGWSLRGDLRIGPEGCRVIRGRFYGPSFTFEQEKELPLAAAGAPAVEVRNAFGGVRVAAGAAAVVKVKLRKVVYLATEDKARAFADRIELRLSGDGSGVRVGTNRDELGRGGDVGFETHFDVEVPPGTELEVRSEHGRVDVAGVGSADVRSSFDDVVIERVAGSVKLEAGHGAVRVSDVGAGLELKGRHGDVEVDGVKGAGKLEVEHGDLVARGTGLLDVALRYGDLTAEKVGGDLVVRAAHAPVHATDVVGRVDVETSYGDVGIVRAGAVRAKVEHGRVTAEDIDGAFEVATTHNDVGLDRAAGPVDVHVERGGASLRGLAKGASVRGEGGDLVLEGFEGVVTVEAHRGNVRLAPRAAIAAGITASARSGEVELEVPEGSRIEIDAESRRGEVHADVPGLATTASGEPGRGQRLAGELAGGGPVVRLRSDGDIRIGSGAVAPIADRPVSKPAPAATASPAGRPTATPQPGAKPGTTPAEAPPGMPAPEDAPRP